MYKPVCLIALTLILLVATSCGGQQPQLTPTVTPLPGPADTPPPLELEGDTEGFLIERLGLDYYRAHLTLMHEDKAGPDLVKATYAYTYEPYVAGFQMTLLLDTRQGRLADQETSIILLEPQTFGVERDEAIRIALEAGLSPGESYDTNVILDATTNNRFAWEVISPAVEPTDETPEPIVRVILDVEGGEVYALEKIGPMTGH